MTPCHRVRTLIICEKNGMIKNEKTQSQGHKILGGESSVLVSDFYFICIHGIYKKKLDGVFLYF